MTGLDVPYQAFPEIEGARVPEEPDQLRAMLIILSQDMRPAREPFRHLLNVAVDLPAKRGLFIKQANRKAS